MPRDRETTGDVETARRYFGSFVEDYHGAFEGRGHSLLHGTINRLFRRKTFQLRTDIVRTLLARHGVAGKRVLDLGCGTGEVSLVAARLGARVTGLDVVDEMVAVAAREARAQGLEEGVTFRVQDITAEYPEESDVTLLVGVIEYYRNLETLLARAARATRELIIIADTRGPWWRRLMRRALARAKQFHLYYRDPREVARVMTGAGFRQTDLVTGHSFTIMAFRRA